MGCMSKKSAWGWIFIPVSLKSAPAEFLVTMYISGTNIA